MSEADAREIAERCVATRFVGKPRLLSSELVTEDTLEATLRRSVPHAKPDCFDPFLAYLRAEVGFPHWDFGFRTEPDRHSGSKILSVRVNDTTGQASLAVYSY